MKVGDLVKFENHTSGPVGVIVGFKTLDHDPHPSQPQRRTACIEWACPYTPRGHYQVFLLEVLSEAR